MDNHLMVDLETLGIRPNAVILSIGACIFDIDKDTPKKYPAKKTFYQNIEVKTSVAAGFKVEQETLEWWKTQPKEAQDLLKVDKISVGKAIIHFRHFFKQNKLKYIWSHGSAFDVVMLEEAIRTMEQEIPWKFQDVRDTRTLYDLAGVKCDRKAGIKHYALDDAINQARAVRKAYKKILMGFPTIGAQ